MAKNTRVVLAAAVVVLVSIVLALSGFLPAAAAVFVVGALGVALLRQHEGDGNDDGGTGQSKIDRALADQGTTTTATTPPPGPAAGGGGLPTWSPSARAAEPTAEPFTREGSAPAPLEQRPERPTAGSSWDAWQDHDRGPVAEDYDDENPLAALDRLDDIDPVAEVERLEGLASAPAVAAAPSSAFTFSSAPKPIDEAGVQTADDIMAASEATELHVNDGEDSELARLLAKVQQRLASYE